ncbi:sigma-70 family RNA polymerase sigma factor [Selenomonas sp. TAMA-11512]|uniref:sigma-70 family RNA polymerase sigma factor n=1 Tax=Selenomonas sp. TAMA-11512 TaxID=3095337 RepID=UPI003092B5B6|nr:sigma-70 family RNA polymerase sigma factor [Selenomonas sp. TAMA-11512]
MQLQDYMEELKRVALLTRAEEAELWINIRQGDAAARSKLIESYQPLVFKAAIRLMKLLDSEEEIFDMLQEGTVALIESVERYEPERGVAFSLYATHRIRGRMLNFLASEGRSDIALLDDERRGGSLGDCLPDPAPAVPEQAESGVLAETVRQVLDRLPEKERLVLDKLYMKSQLTQEVADDMELSTSYILRLQKQAIRRMRGMLSRFMRQWQSA